MAQVRAVVGAELVSERRACRVLGQARSTQRRERAIADEQARLRARIIELATQYGRYGYRRVTALLRAEGWQVNHKRVERIWRQEGLKVPQKQPKRRRLWLKDGSCVRLRRAHRDHGRTPASARSYDFMQERTHDGRSCRLLTIIDEYTRECLAIEVGRRLNSENVLEQLTELFTQRGAPAYLRADASVRTDNGSEFTANAVREWLDRLSVRTRGVASATPKRLRQQSPFIEPGSPADLRSAWRTDIWSPSMASCGTSC